MTNSTTEMPVAARDGGRLPHAGERLAYADTLRVIAVTAVMVLHASGGWLGESAIGSLDWHILNFWDGLTRWCVPLFVMLSGMFLLDPEKPLPLSKLFRKNIVRAAAALAVWGFVYGVYDYRPGAVGFSLEWLRDTVLNLLRGNTHYHLWFMYMMIGLYLLTPILRTFVRGASRADFHYYFLVTLTFASVLHVILLIWPNSTVQMYINRLDIRPILGYSSYYIAGYYFKTFPLERRARRIIYALGILGGIVTVWGTAVWSMQAGQLETLYGNFNPNVAAMTIAIFVFARCAKGEKPSSRFISTAAKISFGMYLAHDLFLILLRKLDWLRPDITPALAIPLQTVFIFAGSFILSWCLSKIPVLGKYIT